MSGLLYLGAIIAFVLLAVWAYRAERPGAPEDGGLFGWRESGESEDPAAPTSPETHDAGERASPLSTRPAPPAWRRRLLPDRRPR
jgi:hypothetical protein